MIDESLAKVIAIDGPSGAGKSSISKKVADRLGVTYIDTGAMFRAIAYYLNKQNIESHEDEKIQEFLNEAIFTYEYDKEAIITLNSEKLIDELRQHKVSQLASTYSKNLHIRNYLKNFQRKIVSNKLSLMEGRDIGTEVFPDAFIKIYLTASVEIRAKRRLEQLKQKGDESQNYEKILKDVEKRDFDDSNREIAPLKQAKDAIVVDSSELSMDEVIDKICELVKLRM